MVPFSALIAEEGEQAITFTSDEALRSKSGDNSTEASVDGTTSWPSRWPTTPWAAATFKETKFKKSRAYGVMLQAVDVDGNIDQNGRRQSVRRACEARTPCVKDWGATSTFDVKLANWPLAGHQLGRFIRRVRSQAYVGDNMVASSTEMVTWD